MKVKNMYVVLLGFLFSVLIGSQVYANSEAQLSNGRFTTIPVEVEISFGDLVYREIDISELPIGAELIELTEEEYQEFLKQLNLLDSISETVYLEFDNLLRRSVSRVSTSGRIVGAWPFIQPTLTFYVYVESTNGRIVAAGDTGWSLTGVTISMSITNPSGHASVTNGRVNASGSVTVNYYLLVSGGIRMYSAPATGSISTADPHFSNMN
ncbi:MAG: hypothetical protein FWF57_06175 [Defluviitaleaceae bacterium]|nr:hypothetical protein [Defluviitaleaceae bacterium]